MPSDYYACVDGDCGSGIQNLVFLGNDFYVYFRDDADGQYYQAVADVDTFLAQGDEALTITPVVNTAGESEIMSSAAKIKLDDVTQYTNVTVTGNADSIVINFADELNAFAALPEFEVFPVATVSVTSSTWSQDKTTLTLNLNTSITEVVEQVAIQSKTPFFLADSDTPYEVALTNVAVEIVSQIIPNFVANNFVSVDEGTTNVANLFESDSLGNNAYELRLTPFGDGQLFELDNDTGMLSFIEPADYESFASINSDNTYRVEIQILDGDDEVVESELFTISIKNVRENVDGVLVDSYLAGALVFQDLNDNGL